MHMKICSFLAIFGISLVSCEQKKVESYTEEVTEVDDNEYILGRSGYEKLAGQAVDESVSFEGLSLRGLINHEKGEVDCRVDKETSSRTWVQVYSANKLKYTLLSNENSTVLKMEGGQVIREPKIVNSLVRKPIIFEKIGGEWQGKLDDSEGALEETPEDRKQIDLLLKSLRFSDKTELLYGLQPRSVGEEWEMTPSVVGLHEGEGVVKAKFMRVIDYKGMACAQSLDYLTNVLTEANCDAVFSFKDGEITMEGPVKIKENQEIILAKRK